MATNPDKSLPPPSILGSIVEICIVTSDIYQTLDGLTRLGIGPFKVYDFNASTVVDREHRGQVGDYELKVAFAEQSTLTFEVMQPVSGSSLMSEYLNLHGNDGVQHVAFDMHNLPMVERQKIMAERGFSTAMQGKWRGRKGQCHFCFFDTLEATGTIFETIEFDEDWEDPDHEWYPAQRAGEGKHIA